MGRFVFLSFFFFSFLGHFAGDFSLLLLLIYIYIYIYIYFRLLSFDSFVKDLMHGRVVQGTWSDGKLAFSFSYIITWCT
jgi:hypothetical protein